MKSIVFVDNKKNGMRMLGFLKCKEPTKVIELFTYRDLIANGTPMRGVRYIFSTWNMPVLGVDEVAFFFPDVQAVFYAAGDTGYFRDAYLQNGIKVFDAKQENAKAVAEYVLTMVLSCNKGVPLVMRKSTFFLWRWSFNRARLTSSRYGGNVSKKIGLIGVGAVGMQVAELLKMFDFEILVYDPFMSCEACVALGVKKVSLEILFKDSNVISMQLADTKDTKNLVDYKLMNLMRPNAVIINVGRGAQLNEFDLLRVLYKKRHVIAVLDVTKVEPIMPWSFLNWHPRVFVTPHIAGSLGSEVERMYEGIFTKYKEFVG